MSKKNTKIAVIQATPNLFDSKGGLTKVKDYIEQVKPEKPNLIVFPEAYLPGYPWGLGFGTVIGNRSESGREQWLKYWENSIEIPSPEFLALRELARKAAAYLVIGIIERDATSGTLYCSLLYFDPTGKLIGKHRKLKPTAAERIIWGEGAGDDLQVINSPIGRIGGLICWENYMPLARMALYQQGIQIYLAPTADQRESWQATMKHIACEGRCFVIGCNQYVTADMYPTDYQEEVKKVGTVLSRGGSVVISPLGKTIAGPLWDEEGILFAELDLSEVGKGKMDFDVVGHYARPDVFDYQWKKKPPKF